MCRDFLAGPVLRLCTLNAVEAWVRTRSHKPHLRPCTIKKKKNLCYRVMMMLSGQRPAQGTCSVVCDQHLQLSSQFSSAWLTVEAPAVVISPAMSLFSCLCCTLVHTDLFKCPCHHVTIEWYLPHSLSFTESIPFAVCVGPRAEQDQHSALFLSPASKAFSTPI